MSFLVLHADGLATALTDEPIVPASELHPLQDAIELLAEAGRLRAGAAAEAEAVRERARVDGYEAGRMEGIAAGQADVLAELFRMTLRETEEQRRRRAEVATLALEAVRRIAGDIGPDALVAGLADRAAAALTPDAVATVRVPPAQLAAVRDRLAGRSGLFVQADPTLASSDCVVETTLGRVHAGFDTQLAQIEAAWARVS